MRDSNETATKQVEVAKLTRVDGALYVEAKCGTTTAIVGIRKNWMTVCCMNASARAWGGFGKTFRTLSEAKAHYKSDAMQAILSYADTLNA